MNERFLFSASHLPLYSLVYVYPSLSRSFLVAFSQASSLQPTIRSQNGSFEFLPYDVTEDATNPGDPIEPVTIASEQRDSSSGCEILRDFLSQTCSLPGFGSCIFHLLFTSKVSPTLVLDFRSHFPQRNQMPDFHFPFDNPEPNKPMASVPLIILYFWSSEIFFLYLSLTIFHELSLYVILFIVSYMFAAKSYCAVLIWIQYMFHMLV